MNKYLKKKKKIIVTKKNSFIIKGLKILTSSIWLLLLTIQNDLEMMILFPKTYMPFIFYFFIFFCQSDAFNLNNNFFFFYLLRSTQNKHRPTFFAFLPFSRFLNFISEVLIITNVSNYKLVFSNVHFLFCF